MTEHEWLLEVKNALTRRIDETITQYDNGQLTLSQAHDKVTEYVDLALTKVSDRAYADGLENAELDGDSDDEEIEFDFNEGDDDDA